MLFPVRIKPKIIRETRDLSVKVVFCPMRAFWSDMINNLFPNARILMTIHDPVPHSGTSLYNKFATKLFNRSSYDAVIVHSKKFIDVIKKQNIAEKVFYIPLGRHNLYRLMDEKRNIIDYDKNKINFVFFGRIEAYKGLDVLAETWKSLDDIFHENISLAIIGNGDFSPYIDWYKDFSNVKIINRWIKDEEVESVFRGENLICVCPYKDGTQSGVVLVAFDYRVPVIITDTGGLSEQVIDGKTGFIIETNNAEMLTKTMEKFILDSKLIKNMQYEIEQYIDEIGWDKSAEKLMRIIGEIL